MPFVQGHLRREPLAITFSSECAHCGLLLRIEVDSDLNYRVEQNEAKPLVFVPLVDFAKLKDLSIIDSF